ncbi:conserved Plasmodium protein, unknown function [Plasmodium gaboni]|uniref:Uncharacterized protein n=1 Tax=Plasmodium gaboni TaxID=647221 RepID=A0ABY1UQT8_9APIC|nr:conserved Plasmodium protein, unknown function [Plasmodium gaboni]
MKDIKSKNPELHNTNKNNKKQKDKKRIEENKDSNNELSKYKQSFYIIKKTINIIKNHYYNKINNIDTLRIREKKKLCYLKRKNVILEDKCTFYCEHVEEIKKLYKEQINMKNEKIKSLQDELDKNRKSEVNIPTNTENILKLREDQIERLSLQIDSLNELYHKQVDINKKLISELEELNKSVLYLNNKIQEERNSREQMKKKLRFYKRYNRNKKNFKLNFDVLNINKDDIKEMKDEEKEKEDICISILCLLKTELELIDDENKKKKREKDDEEKEKLKVKSNNFFKKIFSSNYKHKKSGLLENISKKQFFSFYEKAFTENDKIKFEKKQFFFFPTNIKKNKMKKKYEHIHKELKHNIQMKEIEKKDNNNYQNKNNKWNYLTMNNIYFYNNFNDNFDEEPDNKFFDHNNKCHDDNNNNYEQRNSIDDYVFFKKYNNINSDHIVFTNMIENKTKLKQDESNHIKDDEKNK